MRGWRCGRRGDGYGGGGRGGGVGVGGSGSKRDGGGGVGALTLPRPGEPHAGERKLTISHRGLCQMWTHLQQQQRFAQGQQSPASAGLLLAMFRIMYVLLRNTSYTQHRTNEFSTHPWLARQTGCWMHEWGGRSAIQQRAGGWGGGGRAADWKRRIEGWRGGNS